MKGVRQIGRWSGGAVLFGRQACDALEVFPEKRHIREIKRIGYVVYGKVC